MLVDSDQLLRARLFLATRFGVDSSELSESAVLWRAGGLLGVSSGVSAAACLTSIGYRLDSAGFPRRDEDLTDDELLELEARDTDLHWGDGRADEWSEGDHPRDEGGRFAEGGGSGGVAEPKAARSWMRGFDDRDHQRVMDEHRRTETFHRAQSLKLKDQMATLKERAKTATPRQQASLKSRFERLSEQREIHRVAAAEAKSSRASVSKDLDRARSSHTAGLRAETAARRGAKAARAAAEAQSFMAIGRGHGIGTLAPADDRPATPVSAPHAPTPHPTEADTRAALRDAEGRRAAKSAELAHRDTIARIVAATTPQRVVEDRPRRQVVSLRPSHRGETVRPAGVERTALFQSAASGQGEIRDRALARLASRDIDRATESARSERFGSRAAATVAPSPDHVRLPGAVDRAKVFLRSLLHRGRGALTPAAAQV